MVQKADDVQELDNSLEEKYNDLKESAKDMALMVKTMLAEDGFRIHYPKGAEILLKYLHNLIRIQYSNYNL